MPFDQGPSPRVRGNRRSRVVEQARPRSIPACAGKPAAGETRRPIQAVHPRVCGETHHHIREFSVDRGPSPRVRGNRRSRCERVDLQRSIPACAGKPRASARIASRRRVHPRVCGETHRGRTLAQDLRGPSPRVRGNPLFALIHPVLRGSIPACAGKPQAEIARIDKERVHPRVCGETRSILAWMTTPSGPSPRVRGNRSRARGKRPRPRSIPACAGKPNPEYSDESSAPVHPRVCGETSVASGRATSSKGPSPRVRGNRCASRCNTWRVRSIPACAGKPLRQSDPVSSRMSKIVPAYADSPAMRRIRLHTSRASGSAR